MLTLLLLLLQGGLPGAEPEEIDVALLVDRSHAVPGERALLGVILDIPEGLHIYPPFDQEATLPTRLELSGSEGVTFGEPQWPETHIGTEEGVFKGVHYYEGKTLVVVPFDVTSARVGDDVELNVKVTSQACTNSVCYRPSTKTVAERVRVASEPATPTHQEVFAAFRPADPPPPPDVPEDLGAWSKRMLGGGFAGIVLVGMLGGLISLIQPCVYPMIPITLTYFVKQGGESRGKAWLMACAYGAGIVVSFTGLGALLSWIIGGQGAQVFASNPWVNGVIAAIFFFFAFSLFGLYEIGLPASWQQAMGVGKQRSGIGGAFILGLIFSIVTFTCVVPIAGAVLGSVATAGGRWTGLQAMFVYSLTMALPFLALGAFPGLLKSVPRSGGWLQTAKVTVGFVELALAAQYLANVDLALDLGLLTRNVMLAVWAAITAVTALYLLGAIRLKDDPERPTIGVGRLIASILFGITAVFFASGFDGRPLGAFDLVLPPLEAGRAGPPKADFASLPPALEKAKADRRPIFLEFTGAT